MYKVFLIDDCFMTYAMSNVMVGAESRDDLIAHIYDVFPSTEYIVDEEDVECGCNYDDDGNKIPVGGKIIHKYFPDEQMNEIIADKGDMSRISEVKGLFTDTPYKILHSYGYAE